jgi:hypothetical protein
MIGHARNGPYWSFHHWTWCRFSLNIQEELIYVSLTFSCTTEGNICPKWASVKNPEFLLFENS